MYVSHATRIDALRTGTHSIVRAGMSTIIECLGLERKHGNVAETIAMFRGKVVVKDVMWLHIIITAVVVAVAPRPASTAAATTASSRIRTSSIRRAISSSALPLRLAILLPGRSRRNTHLRRQQLAELRATTDISE